MALLELKNVSKTYNNVTKALQHVSFSVEEGEIVSIIGPSGAGKSTLMRCINRLVDASDGPSSSTARTSPAFQRGNCVMSEQKRA